jgi:hypothetical protein
MVNHKPKHTKGLSTCANADGSVSQSEKRRQLQEASRRGGVNLKLGFPEQLLVMRLQRANGIYGGVLTALDLSNSFEGPCSKEVAEAIAAALRNNRVLQSLELNG